MAQRNICNASLILKVPLAPQGYADGFYCDLPLRHKSRTHQTNLAGSTLANPTFTAVAKKALAIIKWIEDDSQ